MDSSKAAFSRLLAVFGHQMDDSSASKVKDLPSDWQITPTTGGDGTQILIFTRSTSKNFNEPTYPLRLTLADHPEVTLTISARKLSNTLLSATFQDHLLPATLPPRPSMVFALSLASEETQREDSSMPRAFVWVNTPYATLEEAGLVNLVPDCFANTTPFSHHLSDLDSYNLRAFRTNRGPLEGNSPLL